jgi:hypothetical protein
MSASRSGGSPRGFLEACVRDHEGVVLFLEEEDEDFDDEGEEEDGDGAAAGPEPRASSPGATILTGEHGRRYAAATASGSIPAALLEHRGALEKKLGLAVTLAPTIETTTALFELYWSRITKRK